MQQPTKKTNQNGDPYKVGKRLDAYWERHELEECWASYVRLGDQILGRCNITGNILLTNIED